MLFLNFNPHYRMVKSGVNQHDKDRYVINTRIGVVKYLSTGFAIKRTDPIARLILLTVEKSFSITQHESINYIFVFKLQSAESFLDTREYMRILMN